jgi:predicted MFS family arabinose efflux permease
MLWGFCLSAISLIPFALLVRHSAVGQKGKMIGLGNSSSKLGNLLGVGMGAYVQAATSFTYSFVAISVLYFILDGVFIVCQLRLNPVELKTC